MTIAQFYVYRPSAGVAARIGRKLPDSVEHRLAPCQRDTIPLRQLIQRKVCGVIRNNSD